MVRGTAAAPVFYLDQGLIDRERVYVGHDRSKGVAVWLRDMQVRRVVGAICHSGGTSWPKRSLTCRMMPAGGSSTVAASVPRKKRTTAPGAIPASGSGSLPSAAVEVSARHEYWRVGKRLPLPSANRVTSQRLTVKRYELGS
jgi:hypothetical protein